MPALNLDLGYFDHPKTVRLVCLLGRGAAELPIRLWTFCARYHRKDGCLTGYSPEDVEAALGWRGKPGSAVQALLTCGDHLKKRGFLEETEDGFRVHDWEEHQGHLEVYHDRATAASRARWEKARAETKKTRGAPGMLQARVKHSSSNASSNAPAGQGNPTEKNQGSSPTERAAPLLLQGMLGASVPTTDRKPGPIDAYFLAYRERYGRNPNPEEGWIKAVMQRLRNIPEPERPRLLEAFVRDDKPFLCGEAHSLKFFPGELDRLRAKVAGNLSTGRVNGSRSITQPSFQNEGLSGPAKYADVPVKEV